MLDVKLKTVGELKEYLKNFPNDMPLCSPSSVGRDYQYPGVVYVSEEIMKEDFTANGYTFYSSGLDSEHVDVLVFGL